MGFRNEAYAKIWEVKPNTSGRSTSVRLSISKKVGDGQYEDDFTGWVTFIATANDRAAGLKFHAHPIRPRLPDGGSARALPGI